MLAGDSANKSLEKDGVIGCLQRVGDMQQVNLELTSAVFRYRCIGRDALFLAGVIDVVQEGIEMFKIIK